MALTKTERLARFTSIIAMSLLAADPAAPIDGQLWQTQGEIKARIAEETVILNRLDAITLKECGGRPDDPSFDNRDAIMLAMARAQATGRKLLVTKGTWWTSPVLFIQTAPLHVKGSPRAEIKGIEGGGADAVIRIDGEAIRPPLVWMGLSVNNSKRSYVGAAASGTALNIVRLDDWMVTGCTFDAGASWLDQKGDSGLVVNQCGHGIAAYNKLKGQPDKGIYTTGGPDNGPADDWGDWIIAWNNFYRCNTAVSFTRQTRRGRVFGNTITECDLGVGRTEAGTVAPGREVIVSGNTFTRIGARAVRLHMEGGDVVEGNIFTDWGYHPINLTLTANTQSLIRIDGASFAKIEGNTFRFRDWKCTPSHKAIEIRRMEWPVDSNLWTYPVGNQIQGNSFEMQAGTAIYENAYVSGNHTDNLYIGNVTPVFTGAGGNSTHIVRRPDGSVRQLRNNIPTSGTWTPTLSVVGVAGATISYSVNPLERTATYDRFGDLVILNFKVIANVALPAAAVVNASFSGATMTVNSVTSGALAIGQQVTGAAVPDGTTILSGSGTTWTLSAAVVGSNVAITAYPVGQIRVGGLPFPSAGDAAPGNGSPGICTGVLVPTGSVWNTEIAAGVSYIRCWIGVGSNRLLESRDLTSITGAVPVRLAGSVQYRCQSEILWSPVHYDDAILGWFDAADSDTLTIEAGAVSAWRNKGTIAATLAQATAARRPTYSATGWDGSARPCLASTGAPDGPILPSAVTFPGEKWLFVVAERSAQDESNASTGVRAIASTSDASGNRTYLSAPITSTDTAQTAVRLYSSGTGGSNVSTTSWPIGGKAVLFAGIAATTSIGLNGTMPSGAGTLGTGSASSGFTLFGLQEAGGSNFVSRFAGKIAEVLVVNPALLPEGGSLPERQRIEGYLAHKWAIQAFLPSNHIHAVAAPRV